MRLILVGFIFLHMKGYIYKLTSPNGKIYIGQTINIKRRFKEYNKPSSMNRPYKIHRSIKKYGWVNFKKEVVYIGDYNSKLLNDLEIHYIQLFNSVITGLNTQMGGLNGLHSEETKRKMSESAKRLYINNPEKRENPHWVGRKHLDISKYKMSVAKKGVKLNKTWRDNIVKSLLRRGGKLILDMETGIYYNSIKDASFAYGYANSTVRNMLNGYKRNRTNLKKV